VTITWSVTDPESRVSGEEGCSRNFLNKETVNSRVECSATNSAGLRATQSVIVKIDMTKPGPTNAQLIAVNTYSLTSPDTGSRLAAIYYRFVRSGGPSPTNTALSGWTHYRAPFAYPQECVDLYAFAEDNAGNRENPRRLMGCPS
jgi:hypothetical protein